MLELIDTFTHTAWAMTGLRVGDHESTRIPAGSSLALAQPVTGEGFIEIVARTPDGTDVYVSDIYPHMLREELSFIATPNVYADVY